MANMSPEIVSFLMTLRAVRRLERASCFGGYGSMPGRRCSSFPLPGGFVAGLSRNLGHLPSVVESSEFPSLGRAE